MITIQNGFLTASIDERGAELTSVKSADGREYVWQADKNFWPRHCPVLFPFCGRLLGQEYTYKGRTYSIGMHGFARDKLFTAKQQGGTSALFTLTDDEETRAVYPFSFRFSVRFELIGDSLAITYTAENTGADTMYFNFGAHEGYALDGDFEDWSVEFEKREDLRLKEMDVPGFLGRNVSDFRKNVKILPLSYGLFERDTLIFDGLKSQSVTLQHRGRPVAEVNFAGFDNLLLWTKIGAPFLCIEPWTGLPDYVDSTKEIEKKDGILTLKKGETFSLPHTIRFFR